MGKKKKVRAYKIRYTMFMTFAATNKDEAINKAKDFYLENQNAIPLHEFIIEIEKEVE